MKKTLLIIGALLVSMMAGCASVPMGDDHRDTVLKQFPEPPEGQSALYIYRDSMFGGALKKTIYVDGTAIGESAPKVYFYKVVDPGEHTISTESEFSDNPLELTTEAGNTYFIRQYMKMGVFVGGANLEIVDEEEGKEAVRSTSLAKGWGTSS